jgi:hypothetical protein
VAIAEVDKPAGDAISRCPAEEVAQTPIPAYGAEVVAAFPPSAGLAPMMPFAGHVVSSVPGVVCGFCKEVAASSRSISAQ